jgi:DNA mismatch repair protein MutL
LCRVLGQIGGLYVLLETQDGYTVMDPHAAHERVLFERLMKDVTSGTVQTQALLMPESVELSPGDATRVRTQLDLLKAMGFGISEFGGDSFIVDAVPAALTTVSGRDLLLELVQQLERAGERGGKGRWREEAIAQAACKASVKARDRLNLAEVQQLVIDLAACDMPYTCPHGRPTVIQTTFKELNRQFGRE